LIRCSSKGGQGCHQVGQLLQVHLAQLLARGSKQRLWVKSKVEAEDGQGMDSYQAGAGAAHLDSMWVKA
jgi:hypothetical protein